MFWVFHHYKQGQEEERLVFYAIRTYYTTAGLFSPAIISVKVNRRSIWEGAPTNSHHIVLDMHANNAGQFSTNNITLPVVPGCVIYLSLPAAILGKGKYFVNNF